MEGGGSWVVASVEKIKSGEHASAAAVMVALYGGSTISVVGWRSVAEAGIAREESLDATADRLKNKRTGGRGREGEGKKQQSTRDWQRTTSGVI